MTPRHGPLLHQIALVPSSIRHDVLPSLFVAHGPAMTGFELFTIADVELAQILHIDPLHAAAASFGNVTSSAGELRAPGHIRGLGGIHGATRGSPYLTVHHVSGHVGPAGGALEVI